MSNALLIELACVQVPSTYDANDLKRSMRDAAPGLVDAELFLDAFGRQMGVARLRFANSNDAQRCIRRRTSRVFYTRPHSFPKFSLDIHSYIVSHISITFLFTFVGFMDGARLDNLVISMELE